MRIMMIRRPQESTYSVPVQAPLVTLPVVTSQYDPGSIDVLNEALYQLVFWLLMATKPLDPV